MRITSIIWGIVIMCMLVPELRAQNQDNDIKFSGDYNGLTFEQFVSKVESQQEVHFYYRKDWVQNIKLDHASGSDLSMKDVLHRTFLGSELRYYIDSYHDIYVLKGREMITALPEKLIEASGETSKKGGITDVEKRYLEGRKEKKNKTIVFGREHIKKPNERVYLTGRVINAESGEPLVGATFYVEQLKDGVVSDAQGYYRLVVPPGKYTLQLGSMGMQKQIYNLQIWQNAHYNFQFQKDIIPLKEVVVEANKFHNVRGTQMGFQRLDVKAIKEIPVVMGESDLLEVARMLPGVQSAGEGSSGLNVRGSPADQNLFYINRVPVFNTSHLFGFFSAFNPDIVRDFSFYKSNIPARFGGRLASIFDISTREGNQKKFTARGGISPITGRLSVEGPLVTDKGSFVIGGRSTYSDWILRRLKDPDLKNSNAGFYDLAANFSIEPNRNNHLQLFGYYSHDRFTLSTNSHFKYSNKGSSLSWRHLFNERFTGTFSGAFGEYSYANTEENDPLNAYSKNYSIGHYEMKSDFDFNVAPNHLIRFGLSAIYYDLDRGALTPYGAQSLRYYTNLGREYGTENALYVSDEWKIGANLTVDAGIRYSYYAYLGPNKVRQYYPGAPYDESTVIDTASYKSGDFIQTYRGPEWRLALNYLLGQNSSVKLSYNRMRQYLFMLSNTVALSPNDQWKLTDSHIKPQVGDQFSAGFYRNFPGKHIETSIEAYYKKTNDLVEYKNGADLIGNRWIETDVVQGKQDAYGLELMLRKTAGKLNGWISYTYSYARVKVDSKFPENQINSGKAYPANYDIPHSVNVVTNYRLSRRVSFSGNMVYYTGRPITYPSAIYYIDGKKVLNYSLRNEYRLPDYFRVDLSVNIEGNLVAKKLAHSSWMIGVYNLTGRKNAYSVYFKNVDGNIQGYKQSIFGVPILTLTWNFKLGNYASE